MGKKTGKPLPVWSIKGASKHQMKRGRHLVDLPTPVKTVSINEFSGEVRFQARPLNLAEIQELLLQARSTGWLGNGDLSDYLVRRGLSRDREAQRFIRQDHFMVANAAREVWILTLENLAGYVRSLAHTLGTKPRFKTQRYSYSDLATPGCLFHIAEDLQRLDTARLMQALLDEMIVEGKSQGQRLSREEARREVAKYEEFVVQQILSRVCGEEKPLSKLPKRVLPTLAERFCAYLALMRTPDWNQYAEILFLFNSLTNILTFHSNQLGGLDASIWDAKVVTGSPGVFDLIKPLEYPPTRVLAAAAVDLISGNTERLDGSLRATLSKHLTNAREKIREEVHSESPPDKVTVVKTLMTHFARPLRGKRALLGKLTTSYWSEFGEYIDRERERLARGFAADYRAFSRPDCYLLVEGPSDEICFAHFVELQGGADVRIRVLGCGSSSRLAQRYRDLLNEGFIGGIATVLDADAEAKQADLQRLSAKACTVKHFIYPRGVLEDLFSVKMHNSALKLQFPDGPPVTVARPSGGGSILKELERSTWETRRASFSKVDHARSLVKLITTKGTIPRRASQIVKTTCEIAQQIGSCHPRPASHFSVDASSRNFARRWADQILDNDPAHTGARRLRRG